MLFRSLSGWEGAGAEESGAEEEGVGAGAGAGEEALPPPQAARAAIIITAIRVARIFFFITGSPFLTFVCFLILNFDSLRMGLRHYRRRWKRAGAVKYRVIKGASFDVLVGMFFRFSVDYYTSRFAVCKPPFAYFVVEYPLTSRCYFVQDVSFAGFGRIFIHFIIQLCAAAGAKRAGAVSGSGASSNLGESPLSLALGQTVPPKGEPRMRLNSRRTLLPLPLGEVARRSRDGEGPILMIPQRSISQ